MEGTGPVVTQILGRDAFVFNFVGLTVLLAGESVDHLWLVEVGGSGHHLVDDLLVELGQAEAVEGSADQSTQHSLFKMKISK